MRQDELSRITRLVGNGEDEMSGGGLPLPDAFGAVLEYLLDEGEASPEELAWKVAAAVRFKEKRILAIWGGWDAFTADIIAQLADSGLIGRHDGQHWRLAGAFSQGVSQEVISAAQVSAATGGISAAAVTVTAYDAAAREDRNRTAKLVFAVMELKAVLERAGRLTAAGEDCFARVLLDLKDEDPPKPPRPAPEPEVTVICQGCAVPKALTYANYSTYWSRNRWHWRPTCENCLIGPDRVRYQKQLIAAIEELGDDAPLEVVAERCSATRRTVARSWDQLAMRGLVPPRAGYQPPSREPQETREEGNGSRSRRISGQTRWYRSWVPSAGWHTQMQARAAWNELFPDRAMLTEKASAFRHASKEMMDRGEMERRPAAPGERGHVAYEYRWIPEQDR